jgi:hypothetical protein
MRRIAAPQAECFSCAGLFGAGKDKTSLRPLRLCGEKLFETQDQERKKIETLTN